MCGRYYIAYEDNDEEIARIIAELNKEPQQAAKVTYGEIFPSQHAPIIVNTLEGWRVKAVQWGFPRGGGGLVINSRSERANVSYMFSKAVQQGRCLVPVSGFYEWRRGADGEKTKDKFSFSLADGAPMFLAGVCQLPDDGTKQEGCFAILTQPADVQMLPYHHRMPVILDSRKARHAWLFSPPGTPYNDLQSLFHIPKLLIRQTAG